MNKSNDINHLKQAHTCLADDDPDSSEVSSLLEYPHADEVNRNLALMNFKKRNSKGSGSGSSGGNFSGRPKR